MNKLHIAVPLLFMLVALAFSSNATYSGQIRNPAIFTYIESSTFLTIPHNSIVQGESETIGANAISSGYYIEIKVNGAVQVGPLKGTATYDPSGLKPGNYTILATQTTGGEIMENGTLRVSTAPTYTLTPSNTILDSGQTETFTITEKNGLQPFETAFVNLTNTSSSDWIVISGSGNSTD